MIAKHIKTGRTVFITAIVNATRLAGNEAENDASVQLAKCFVDGGTPTAFPLTDLEVSVDASLLAWVRSPEWAAGMSFERWQSLEAYALRHGSKV